MTPLASTIVHLSVIINSQTCLNLHWLIFLISRLVILEVTVKIVQGCQVFTRLLVFKQRLQLWINSGMNTGAIIMSMMSVQCKELPSKMLSSYYSQTCVKQPLC